MPEGPQAAGSPGLGSKAGFLEYVASPAGPQCLVCKLEIGTVPIQTVGRFLAAPLLQPPEVAQRGQSPRGVSCWLQACKSLAPCLCLDVLPSPPVSPIRLSPPLDSSYCPCPVPGLPSCRALRTSGSHLYRTHSPAQVCMRDVLVAQPHPALRFILLEHEPPASPGSL